MTPILVPLKRPLVCVSTACAVLACTNEDAVLALVDSGKLRWAFNIASRGSRRVLRIFAGSLADYVAGRKLDEDFNKVLATILPGHSERIRGANLARMLLCSREHVKHLLAGREFAGSVTQKAGPNSSPEITRVSILKFLRSRVI
jgi:hypothetical protein